jgi:hypothetical protein
MLASVALLICVPLWSQPEGIAPPEGLANLTAPTSGARVARASSDYGTIWDREHVLDGDLTTGWASEDGRIRDEFLIVDLGDVREVAAIGICPSATGKSPVANAALRTFEVRVSTTTQAPKALKKVTRGRCVNRRELQFFTFEPTKARYVSLVARSNYGHPRWVEVAEFAVFGPASQETPGTPEPDETPGGEPAPTAEQPAVDELASAEGRVLCDTGGWGAAGDLRSFLAQLQGEGFEVRQAGTEGGEPLSAADLAEARVLVLHLRESLTPEETAAAVGFVWAGGGMLVSVESPTGKSDFLAETNEFVGRLGAAVSEAEGEGGTTALNQSHPVTSGLAALEVGPESVAIWSRQLTRLARVDREACAVCGAYGSGRVAIIAADLIQDQTAEAANIKAADNAEFAMRLVRWLADGKR